MSTLDERTASLMSPEPFEALYCSMWPRVVDYLRFRIGPYDATDVAAEVFVRAWRARAQFAPERGTPESWLWGIARNAARDHRRGATATVALDAAEGIGDAGLTDHGAHVETMANVATALSRLEPIDRDIVALRFGGGLPFRDVGAAVGLAEAAAATRLHRAIKRLRGLLDERNP